MRSARPCSPSAQRSASARLLLPDPLGPTTALIPGPNSTTRPLGERLEALEPESAARRRRRASRRRRHAAASGPSARRCRARRGRCSRRHVSVARARRRRRQSPRSAGTRPRRADDRRPRTSMRTASRGRARSPRRPVDGPLAGRPLGVLLEPALGALQADSGSVARRAPGAASSMSQSRATS